jgi:two-component system response regulator VicR
MMDKNVERMKLLIVDDDRDLVDLLAFSLDRAGFETVAAHDAPSAIGLIKSERPNLVVLDINLGAWNGLELLKELRAGSQIPVILLTARGREEDKVSGLDLGADDYVTKPFSHRELAARIRAVLRRHGQEPPDGTSPVEAIQVGPLTLRLSEHAAFLDSAPLNLTVTEFRLLTCLASRAGTVVPTPVILKTVWGYEYPGGSDTVRVAIYRLRRKIEVQPANPKLIQTVTGVGFILKPPA